MHAQNIHINTYQYKSLYNAHCIFFCTKFYSLILHLQLSLFHSRSFNPILVIIRIILFILLYLTRPHPLFRGEFRIIILFVSLYSSISRTWQIIMISVAHNTKIVSFQFMFS